MNSFIQAIYCDDIRREDTGKLCFIGVYQGFLYANQFPITLPKFCIYLNIVTPATQPFEPSLLRVYKDDEILRENKITEAITARGVQLASEMPTDAIDQRAIVLNAFHTFSPFQLDEPCFLRVRLESDGSELARGVGLRIDEMPDDMAD